MDKDVADTFQNMMMAFAAVEQTLQVFADEGEKDAARIVELETRVAVLEGKQKPKLFVVENPHDTST